MPPVNRITWTADLASKVGRVVARIEVTEREVRIGPGDRLPIGVGIGKAEPGRGEDQLGVSAGGSKVSYISCKAIVYVLQWVVFGLPISA